jgi:hypothetical protein
MKRFYSFAAMAGLALVLAASSSWGGGVNPTVSDNQFNTAGGTLALGMSFNGGNANVSSNTAFGQNALYNNSTGRENTATGSFALSANTTGASNTAAGDLALGNNSGGNDNTATGSLALYSNSTGSDNTATGVAALENLQNNQASGNTATGALALTNNADGSQNTATGMNAMREGFTGSYNTATGANALYENEGAINTADGFDALYGNTTGGDNTACGGYALNNNTTGSDNTATGAFALPFNITGNYNTADGVEALYRNITGTSNTASGFAALFENTGSGNTAVGMEALVANTGSNNIGLGFLAGKNLTTGNNNVDIGNPGVAAESKTIRIGSQGTQTATYIAGIAGAGITGGADVFVNSSGRLGIVLSSARYKHDIRDMGGASVKLLELRPVTFRYNRDPTDALQYGLVAEEVAKVYPELVVYGPDSKPETVRYSMLSAMLLNELQRQDGELRNQAAANQRRADEIRKLDAQVGALKTQVAQENISTERKIGKLEASHQRELQLMRADFEQRLSVLERAARTGAPMPVKF